MKCQKLDKDKNRFIYNKYYMLSDMEFLIGIPMIITIIITLIIFFISIYKFLL